MRTHTRHRDGSGNGPASDYINQLHQRLDEAQPYDSTDITVEQTTRGIRFYLKNPAAAGGQASGVQAFQLVSDSGDWYNCYMFDGKTVGKILTKVAKDQDLRCILPTALPAGGAWATRTERTTVYTYTYTTVGGVTTDGVNVIEYYRKKTPSGGTGLDEYVTPCLNVGDIIYALPASFAGPATLVGVSWLALPGRYFATRIEDIDPNAS
jgi:hypothetical protein